jgi:hypothetical protein
MDLKAAIAALTIIEFCLLDPLANRLDRGLELARQRGNTAAGSRQFHESAAIFCCVW